MLNIQKYNIHIISETNAGYITFRRAEDKVTERYEILNPKFFQNIRLSLSITRREWSTKYNKMVVVHKPLTLDEHDIWTVKLRFRTL